MSGPSPCPDLPHLRAVLEGTLADEEQSDLTDHLDGCPRCQERLENLASGTRSWSGKARQLAAAPAAQESALRWAMDELKVQSPARAASDPPLVLDQLSLSFLASPAQPEHLGRLGPYEILQVLGRGGMGIVLKAVDPVLRRIVAIKVLAPHLATSDTARKRFAREAKAAAAVRHDNIVAIHHVDEVKGLPYLVMEYVPGLSLQQRIDRDGPVEVEDVLSLGAQIASGLAAAHAQGLVHRDIKPANILLDHESGRVKITDFGLARAADDASLTQSGFLAGTPQYMAPEQARGEAVDHRADLFSLGSVLYTLATGRPPFRASTTLGVLRRVTEEEPRPVSDLNPEVPDWLVAVIERLHAKDPDDRYRSADTVSRLLRERLAGLRAEGPVNEPRTRTTVRLDRPSDRRGLDPRWFVAGGVLLLSIGAAALVVALAVRWPGGTKPEDRQTVAANNAIPEAPKQPGAPKQPDAKLAPPPPAKPEPKPLTDKELDQALFELKSGDHGRCQAAAKRLANAVPTEGRRAEIAKALEPMTTDANLFQRWAAVEALGTWGTKESIPILIKLIEDEQHAVRWAALASLGRLQDERGAEAVAKRLTSADRGFAAKALQAMGPVAEKALLKYIDDREWSVRLLVCQTLKVVGTKESLPALEAAKNDDNGNVRMAAEDACKAVAERK
jgi:serine/threonine protein kinase